MDHHTVPIMFVKAAFLSGGIFGDHHANPFIVHRDGTWLAKDAEGK
jgi:hypothetical protein